MHDETRPLATLTEPAPERPRTPVMIGLSALALLLPILIVVLL